MKANLTINNKKNTFVNDTTGAASSMAQWLRSLTLRRKDPGSFPGRAQKVVSIAAHSITASDSWGGAVNDKNLAVSSDQGNTYL